MASASCTTVLPAAHSNAASSWLTIFKVLSAGLENGLLHIELAREVPEEKKPRQIKIANAGKTRKLENKAA